MIRRNLSGVRVCVACMAMLASGGTAASTMQADSRVRSAPVLWAGLEPGQHGVGFRRLETVRGTAFAWYPVAAPGVGDPLTFRDYAGDASDDLAAFLASTGIPSGTIDQLFGSRLFAHAAPRPGDRAYPVVVVAQGNGQTAIDQVVLCEYLASRGFVVVTTPSPMRETPLEREDQVGEFAEWQARDLAAAIDAVANSIPVDTRRIGVVGHSFGARAGLLLAMQDARVAAIVSLDGGIGTATAVAAFRQAPSFDPEARLPPILHFYERLDAFMAPDFGMLESLHVDELDLEPTEGMHHIHFTTYGFASAAFPELATATHADANTAGGVVAVAHRAGEFLLDRLAPATDGG